MTEICFATTMSTLYHGDVLETLKGLPDKSAHCCVTSPPYYSLRDYSICSCVMKRHDRGMKFHGDKELEDSDRRGCASATDPRCRKPAKPDCRWCNGTGTIPGMERVWGGQPDCQHEWRPDDHSSLCLKCGALLCQLGLEPSLDDFLTNMVTIFREVRRVLRDDATLWLNIGDSYSAGGRKTQAGDKLHEARGIGYRVPAEEGIKAKDMLGVPWALAFALRADGWYLRQEIIWHKPSPMPESARDRCTKGHEHIFLLTKRRDYFYDQDGERLESKLAVDWETYNKLCDDSSESWYPRVSGDAGDGETKHGNMARVAHPNGSNLRTVWTLPTEAYKGAHFAAFPKRLPERCVKLGTSAIGCCSKCGEPWTRIVKRERYATRKGAGAKADDGTVDANRDTQRHCTRRQTTGFEQQCECGEVDVVPCAVLEPFAGTGTVLDACSLLGRRSIGIEINPEYCEQIRRRVIDGRPLLHACEG